MNSMDVVKKGPETFEITRRTARARGFSWCGTVFFALGLLCSGYLFFDLNSNRGLKLDFSWFLKLLKKMKIERKPLTNLQAVQVSIFIVLFFLIAIIFWVASKKAQKGTISFCDGKISCRCERTFVDLMPGQISSVERYGDVVKIYYLSSVLAIRSEKAAQIEDRVKDFINEYKFSNNITTSEKNNIPVSADRIREYKQLVDEGIITKEQFDEIIKKMTKA